MNRLIADMRIPKPERRFGDLDGKTPANRVQQHKTMQTKPLDYIHHNKNAASNIHGNSRARTPRLSDISVVRAIRVRFDPLQRIGEACQTVGIREIEMDAQAPTLPKYLFLLSVSGARNRGLLVISPTEHSIDPVVDKIPVATICTGEAFPTSDSPRSKAAGRSLSEFENNLRGKTVGMMTRVMRGESAELVFAIACGAETGTHFIQIVCSAVYRLVTNQRATVAAIGRLRKAA